MNDDKLDQYRYFLKDSVRKVVDFRSTDQSRGLKSPPIQKPVKEGAKIIKLKGVDEWLIPDKGLSEAIGDRKSHRKFKREPITIDELSFLLWATQGVRKNNDSGRAYRNVPSAGCRHSFETYLAILNVEGIEEGIYRYLPLSHSIVFEHNPEFLKEEVVLASFNQPYPGDAAVTFIWTSIPYRMEWRYGIAAHKVILLDAGHVCQNLYLACEAIGTGTCAIAAYDQEKMDELLKVDGYDEFTVYLSPVGRVR